MFVSIDIIFNPETSTGFGLPCLDRRSRDFEDCSAVTPHFPSCIPLLVSADKGEESKSMNFLPGQILKVLCVCHQNIDNCVPICSFPRMKSQMKLRA